MVSEVRIAQVVSTFPPYMGGIGNSCYNLSLELGRLGHEVTVFTSNCLENGYPYPEEFKVKRLRPLIKYGNSSVLPGLLRIKNFDIIHLHSPFPGGAEFVCLNSNFRKIPYVTTYHMDVIGKGLVNLFFKIYSLPQYIILKRARKIIVTSKDYALHSRIKSIINERKKEDIIEIPLGVNTSIFNPKLKNKKLKDTLGIKNEKVILFVGALDKAHYFKGVDILIKSFSKIKNRNAKLIIVGEGDLKTYYMDIARKLKVSENVIFIGGCGADLPKYYSLADFVVLPSIDMGEAFGIVLVEAMACGKPVIASDLPGVRTVVENGRNGFLVRPGDVEDLLSKMDSLLESTALRKRFGDNGRKKVEEKYDWKKIAKTLIRVYKKSLIREHE